MKAERAELTERHPCFHCSLSLQKSNKRRESDGERPYIAFLIPGDAERKPFHSRCIVPYLGNEDAGDPEPRRGRAWREHFKDAHNLRRARKAATLAVADDAVPSFLMGGIPHLSCAGCGSCFPTVEMRGDRCAKCSS